MGYKRALRNIHFPVDWTFQKKARKRLAFDELFLYALALSYMKQNKKQESKFVMMKDHKTDSLRKSLPYELTSSQKKVWAELCQDMKSGYCMNLPGTGRCWIGEDGCGSYGFVHGGRKRLPGSVYGAHGSAG